MYGYTSSIASAYVTTQTDFDPTKLPSAMLARVKAEGLIVVLGLCNLGSERNENDASVWYEKHCIMLARNVDATSKILLPLLANLTKVSSLS